MAAGRENFIFFLCPLDGVRFKQPVLQLLMYMANSAHPKGWALFVAAAVTAAC